MSLRSWWKKSNEPRAWRNDRRAWRCGITPSGAFCNCCSRCVARLGDAEPAHRQRQSALLAGTRATDTRDRVRHYSRLLPVRSSVPMMVGISLVNFSVFQSNTGRVCSKVTRRAPARSGRHARTARQTPAAATADPWSAARNWSTISPVGLQLSATRSPSVTTMMRYDKPLDALNAAGFAYVVEYI